MHGFESGRPRLPPDRWDGINQCVKLGDIVAVRAGEDYRERDALRFGDEVVL